MSNIKRINGIPFDLDGCKGMTKERLTISYGKGSAHALSQRALDDMWEKLRIELGHPKEDPIKADKEEVDLHPTHSNGEADEIDKEVVKEDFKSEDKPKKKKKKKKKYS